MSGFPVTKGSSCRSPRPWLFLPQKWTAGGRCSIPIAGCQPITIKRHSQSLLMISLHIQFQRFSYLRAHWNHRVSAGPETMTKIGVTTVATFIFLQSVIINKRKCNGLLIRKYVVCMYVCNEYEWVLTTMVVWSDAIFFSTMEFMRAKMSSMRSSLRKSSPPFTRNR